MTAAFDTQLVASSDGGLLVPRPVILVHLITPGSEHDPLTACTGHRFRPATGDGYPQVPRQPCPACLLIATGRLTRRDRQQSVGQKV